MTPHDHFDQPNFEQLLRDPRVHGAVPEPDMVGAVAERTLRAWRRQSGPAPQADAPHAVRRLAWLPLLIPAALLFLIGVLRLGGAAGWWPRYDMRLKYWMLDLLDVAAEGLVYHPLPTAFALAAATALLGFALWPDARRAVRGILS